ncbi:22488_t:CDS:10 [Entrophospora sp. SA101]|nr:22488_t:CDS:10 [Entrophospora sp. SA101]
MNFKKILVPLLIFITVVNCCGLSVHNEVTVRAIEFFKPTIASRIKYSQFLKKYKEIVQFFPIGNDEAAEDASTEYIRENYNNSTWENDVNAQKIIAFLFAIVSHGAADTSWHSLEMESGFINAMAEMNYWGVYNDAHQAADNGGEFTLSHMSEIDYLGIPFKDLIAIYEKMGKTVTEPQIQFCIKRSYAFAEFNKSPFLIEQLENYHRGGLNNMAANVHDCWNGLSNWFEDGPGNYSSLCDAFKKSFFTEPRYNNKKNWQNKDNGLTYVQAIKILEANGFEIDFYKDENGIGHLKTRYNHNLLHHQEKEHLNTIEREDSTIKIINQNAANNNQINFNFKPTINTPQLSSKMPSPPISNICSSSNTNNKENPDIELLCKALPNDSEKIITLDSLYPYASFGHDMIVGDFNGDGIEDLVISAPYYSNDPIAIHLGAIFIFYGKRNNQQSSPPKTLSYDIIDTADQIIQGHDLMSESRFGWSLAVVDMNSDGIDDLAVGAPSFGAKDLAYTGKVYIYFGSKDAKKLSDVPDIQIRTSSNTVKDNLQIEGFGYVLASGDIDNDGYKDLIIGCPHCGMYNITYLVLYTHSHIGAIFAFLSSSNHQGNISRHDNDWQKLSPEKQAYEWFGSAIEVVKSPNNNSNSIIVVGAPGYGNKKQTVGKIYGFEIISTTNKIIKSFDKFDLSGTSEFQAFGSLIISGNFLNNGKNYILITSKSESYNGLFPGYKIWQAGAVRLLDLDYIKQGALLSDEVMKIGNGLLLIKYGSESSSHLGSSVYWDEIDRLLFVSEPFTFLESGRVYKYAIIIPKECINGRQQQTRFGSKIIKYDFNGDGKKDLLIAAKHSSTSSSRCNHHKITLLKSDKK